MWWGWPLIGRHDEMRLVATALADPGLSGVVFGGPAGIGKSRIVREAVAAAEGQGWEPRWMVGTSCGRSLPLGAVASWPGLVGEDSLHLVCGVIDSMATTDASVVVGVDDPHLVDDLSMFVLHQIVQRQVGKVVMTVREDEPISTAVQELWKIGTFQRLTLPALTPDQTSELLTAVLDGPADPAVPQQLWNLTHGNALYLRHIVEQAVADGRLRVSDGYWRWTGPPTLPRTLVEVVESRVGALPDPVSTVVDALAVGEPITLPTLRRIAGQNAVEDAETRGLVRLEEHEDRIDVRLAHPLYGEVRRRHAPATKLRRLRGTLAVELAAGEHSEDVQVLVRRAALSLDSDVPPDADLLVRAAQGAICLADLALADRLAAAGERAGGGTQARFVRAHAVSWLGRGQDAESLLQCVSVDRLTDRERARFTYLRASNLLWVLAEPERARAVIDDSAAVEGSARNAVDAMAAVYHFAVDQPEVALEVSRHLVLDELPPVVGAEMAWALATMHGDAGRTTAAVAAAEAGYAIAVGCSDAPHMWLNIADAHVGALVLAGRIGEALDVAASARDRAADLPGAAHLLGPAIAGRAALGAGRVDEACSLLQQAAEGLTASGHALGWGFRYHVPLATALAMRGATTQAACTLDKLSGLPRRFRSLDFERSLAQAWVVAGNGALGEAVDLLRSAGARAARHGRFADELVCLQTAVQFGYRPRDARLPELCDLVEGPRAGLTVRFGAAACSQDADQLSAISTDFADMRDDLAAVDSAALACLAYRERDLRGSALASMTRAEALALRSGADTPTLQRAREPLPLTDREREIVAMLGQGLSNREVAERLTLSVRTVEGHIYKAMTKTGTASREELAALLTRNRVLPD